MKTSKRKNIEEFAHKQGYDTYELGEYTIVKTKNHTWGLYNRELDKVGQWSFTLLHANTFGDTNFHRQGGDFRRTMDQIKNLIKRHDKKL